PSQREILAHRLGVSSQSSQRLVAYVIARSGEVDRSALRDVLKAKLPNYMVPAAIVSLSQLPRTANGKIDIRALPEPQLGGAATDIALPRTKAEEILVQIWKEVLRLDTIDIYDNFFELGGDSILSIQIVSRAREAGLRLAPNQLFEQPTVAELAAVVNLVPDVAATQDVVTGDVPLTPIQHWFFEQQMEMPQHWHQAMLVEISDGVDVLNKALATLWTHHDALRMRFDHSQQINADAKNPPKALQIDLSHLGESEQIKTVADHGNQLHSGLNLADGGLMQAVLFTRGPRSNWLLLSLHHLVIDAISWQILLEDLSHLLNGATQLPEKTTSFKTWAKTLISQTPTRQPETHFWLNQLEQSVISLPRDYPDAVSPTEATTQTVTVALSAEDTQALLQKVPAAYNTQINDALLTALALALLQWVGAASGSVRVEVEAHGREQIADEIDLSRTVGWFTTTYPIDLQINTSDNCTETLKSVKEQLRQVPARGIGYGMLRYLGEDAVRQQLAQAMPSEVLFNYLGQQGSSNRGLRVIQDIDVGQLRDPRNRRSYFLDVNAWVADGQLQINWRYDTQIHRSEALTMVANQYVSILKTLIVSCADEKGGFTPSDFPDADLDQTELDDFISQLTEEA
ncbi:MAG: condensation domain-containing protein, partial [Cyanobacteria bacterium P01_F01_bin.116]